MHVSEDFDAFVAIVETGSISKAARVLGTPRATLSRRLTRLERRLGVRLVNRTTRTLVLTRAGEALYPRARRLLEEAQETVAAVQRLDDAPRGLLRVACAPLHRTTVGEMIGEFISAYPDVSVELLTSTRHIDLAADQIDVALRGGVDSNPNLMSRRLVHSSLSAVASPDYIARNGIPEEAEQLRQHTCLRGFSQGERPALRWPTTTGGSVTVDGPLVSNDIVAVLGSALSGLGIGLLPQVLIQEHVDAGRLVRVLDGIIGMKVTLTLVWPERQFVEPKVRAFVDHVVKWTEEGRLQDSGYRAGGHL
ncbi:MAG: LysR substrate-binding domain-containing protein [Myxococcota bacterium]